MTTDHLYTTPAGRTRMVWLRPLSLLITITLLLVLSACGANSTQLPQGVKVKATTSATTDEPSAKADTPISDTATATESDTPQATPSADADADKPVDTPSDTAEAPEERTNTQDKTAEASVTQSSADEDAQATATSKRETETITDTVVADATGTETSADVSSSDVLTITMADIIETTRHFKGDDDAPVTIIEFSDFQCPYCSRFAKETIPQIVKDYIDKGLVRIGYRHAAYHGGDAFLAAEASECAADQDAFWNYHDLLIDRMVVDGKQDFPQEVLKQLATDLDLDSKMFNTCLESGTYADLVREETNESQQTFQVSGTPTFLINGTRLVGAYPYPDFQDAIEAALGKKTDSSEQIVQMEEERPDPKEQAQKLMNILLAETRHFKGDPDAPITIFEFSDFQCPFCSRFASETAPQIDDMYIQKGLVRIGYIHAAYHGGEAYTAAEASECAADQNAFWDYHDLLIKRLADEGKHDFPNDVLKQYAADLHLDTKQFNTCLDEGTYADAVRQQTEMSQYIGVTGTPTFVINGKGLVGAQPFEVFQQVLDEELAAAK